MGNLMREVRSWLDDTEKVLQLLQEEKDLSNENKIHETIEVGFSQFSVFFANIVKIPTRFSLDPKCSLTIISPSSRLEMKAIRR